MKLCFMKYGIMELKYVRDVSYLLNDAVSIVAVSLLISKFNRSDEEEEEDDEEERKEEVV